MGEDSLGAAVLADSDTEGTSEIISVRMSASSVERAAGEGEPSVETDCEEIHSLSQERRIKWRYSEAYFFCWRLIRSLRPRTFVLL